MHLLVISTKIKMLGLKASKVLSATTGDDFTGVIKSWMLLVSHSLEGALDFSLSFIDFQFTIFTTLKCLFSRIELIKTHLAKSGLVIRVANILCPREDSEKHVFHFGSIN